VIEKGETATHTVHLEAGDYLEAHLNRDRYKVKFRLLPPDGSDESAAIGWGEFCPDPPGESIWGLADTSGDYKLTVSLYPRGEPGPYKITLLAVHSAGDAERARQAGEVEFEKAAAAKSKGHYTEALELFHPALELWKKAGYLRGIAAGNGRIGQCLYAIDRFDEAVPYIERAVELWEEAGDYSGVVSNLILRGNLEIDRHHWEAAEEAVHRAIEVAPRSLAPRSPGSVSSSLCYLQWARGQIPEAFQSCQKAVSLLEEAGALDSAPGPLNQLGLMYRRLGKPQPSRAAYKRCLEILQDYPDAAFEAIVHNNLGTLILSQGDYQGALVEYQTSLDMYREQGNLSEAAARYYSIGTVYQKMGQLKDSLDYYGRARDLQENLESTEDLIYTLLGIGWVHLLRSEPDLAVEPTTRALRLAREADFKPLLARALQRMALLQLALNRPKEALELTQEGLPIARETRNRWQESALLGSLATAEHDLGQTDEALASLRDAVRVSEDIGDWTGLEEHEYQMAQIYRDGGQLDQALGMIEQVLAIADRARDQIDVQEFRSLVGATQQQYHSFYIDLLLQVDARDPGAGHAAEAFQAAERARARSLLEVLSAANLDVGQQAPAELVAQRDALRQKLTAAEQHRSELLEPHDKAADSSALFQNKVELDRLVTDLAEVERKIRAASPRYAELTRPKTVTVEQIQQSLLDPDTALLEFRLAEKRSFLFLVTPSAFRTFELPPRRTLEEDSRCIHWLLTAFADEGKATADSSGDRELCLGSHAAGFEHPPTRNPFEAHAWRRRQIEEAYSERARHLGESLLGDASRSGLLAGRRLAVVTDGALEYVPFAALPEPGTGRPLVVGHELVSLPSASVLAFQRRQAHGDHPYKGTVAVIADPLYGPDDERVAPPNQDGETLRSGTSARHFARLPFAEGEAKAIIALAPPGRSLLELGPEATKESVLGTHLTGYRYVHFAVHGLIDADYPALSRLVLSQVDGTGQPLADGSLRLHDIYDMRLDAQMVVLSACDTALGQEIRGEGLVGLARGFMYAGAHRVVASLWQVQDVATAPLMEDFYRGLLEEHHTPADALREAQIAMLTADDGRQAFPYYWAGFVLQGDWR